MVLIFSVICGLGIRVWFLNSLVKRWCSFTVRLVSSKLMLEFFGNISTSLFLRWFDSDMDRGE